MGIEFNPRDNTLWDVAMLPDGSLLVSDDYAGALYRIWYAGE